MGNLKDDLFTNIGVMESAKPCIFEECTCPPMGISACLTPHRVSLKEYNEMNHE
jgi:hypothetical protein